LEHVQAMGDGGIAFAVHWAAIRGMLQSDKENRPAFRQRDWVARSLDGI
jgi:hypothetical protein